MLPKPDIKINAGIYNFIWEAENIEAIVDHINSNKGTLTGEVTIYHREPGSPELLEQTKLNLSSSTARNKLAKELESRSPEVDWISVIKYVCIITVNDYRKGEPLESLGDKPDTPSVEWTLHPLLEHMQPTTIYGPGGTGKSYLALLWAVLIQYNYAGPHAWVPKSGNVLYLDWESGRNAHKKRVWAIKQGMEINSSEKIYYRFCTQPLSDDIAQIQRIVSECDASLAIIDSQVAASGDDPEKADSVNKYYNALRSLKITTLTVDHVPKNTEGKMITPYGSVFKWNRARSLFEIKHYQEPGENSIEIGIYHRKHNEGKLLKPIGIKIQFHNEEGILSKVTFTDTDLAGIPELAKGMTAKEQIKRAILDSWASKLRLAQLYEVLPDIPEGTIRGTLDRYKNKEGGFIKLEDESWALVSKELL